MKIPKNIKAVIFDLDGLLIDSEKFWDEADTILLKKRGFNPTQELFLRRLGTGHIPTLEIYKKEFGIDENIDSLSVDRLNIFYGILWKSLQLMEGAEELIKSLQKQKPSPDIFLHASKKLNVDPSICLVLEDAPSGIVAAKSAGMMAWGVNKDKATQIGLKKAGADEVFSSLSEITV